MEKISPGEGLKKKKLTAHLDIEKCKCKSSDGSGGGLAGERNLGALTCDLSLSKLSKPVSRWEGGVSLTSSQKRLGYFLQVSQRALGAFRISCKLITASQWGVTE